MQKPPKILIVDDSTSNLRITLHALKPHYELSVATDGASAIEILKTQQKPDLVLLDVMLPDMTGHDVCTHIKSDPETRNIPVIFVTAKDDLEDQQIGFDLGAVDYIIKPIQIPLLLARVNVHMRLKRMTENLESLAFMDGLTDIPNRRALKQTLDRECARSIRDGHPLSVLMIDIDHFKAFNDNYGHGSGDQCLRQVAEALSKELRRPADFIGRYGGEEFAVVLPNCNLDGARTVAESLRSRIHGLAIEHAYSSTSEHVTISIGAAQRSVGGKNACELLLQAADRALYCAKELGRNQVQVASSAPQLDNPIIYIGQ